jgi:4-diphosphocytidyl-2-C-methyl-D-erythritol kinase
MSVITIEAPAKLNLHLKVGGRRPDGFHDIESLFLALALRDTLRFETMPPGTPPEISMNGPLALQLGGENIILRAISLFRERTGFNAGLKVTVEKRIPMGGGLGGGSSDAAAALGALNRLAADDGLLSGAELAEMGASLGSDVPFFLCESPAAWVTGRGERIQPLELPKSIQNVALVLVNPGFPSDTAEAYRLFDLATEDTGVLKRNLSSLHEEINSPPQNWAFSNDFLPILAASDKGLVYQHIITGLRERGAEFAGLSGSGSTCFGVFSGQDRAESARETLAKRWPFVIITFLLARSTIPCYNRK